MFTIYIYSLLYIHSSSFSFISSNFVHKKKEAKSINFNVLKNCETNCTIFNVYCFVVAKLKNTTNLRIIMRRVGKQRKTFETMLKCNRYLKKNQYFTSLAT